MGVWNKDVDAVVRTSCCGVLILGVLFSPIQANHVAEAAVYEASGLQAAERNTLSGGGSGGGAGRGSIRVRAEPTGVVYAVPMDNQAPTRANGQHQTQTQTHGPTSPRPDGYFTVGRATAAGHTNETIA